jgi:hypothetical protein
MKELFKDILHMKEVEGIILLTFDGRLVYKEFKPSLTGTPENLDWPSVLSVLEGLREADFNFENGRIYCRRTGVGYLVVISKGNLSGAMLRLNCDILMPSLNPSKQSRSLKRFFKK